MVFVSSYLFGVISHYHQHPGFVRKTLLVPFLRGGLEKLNQNSSGLGNAVSFVRLEMHFLAWSHNTRWLFHFSETLIIRCFELSFNAGCGRGVIVYCGGSFTSCTCGSFICSLWMITLVFYVSFLDHVMMSEWWRLIDSLALFIFWTWGNDKSSE